MSNSVVRVVLLLVPVDVSRVEDDDVRPDGLPLARLVDVVHALHVRLGLHAAHLGLKKLEKAIAHIIRHFFKKGECKRAGQL